MNIGMKENMGVVEHGRVQGARTHLFEIYGGQKWRIAMKIGRKEDMDVADEMIFNLVSHRSCNYVQSVPKRT